MSTNRQYRNGSSWYTVPSGGELPSSSLLSATNGYSNGDDMNTENTAYVDDDYDSEPPLIEELGINFDHIYLKTQAVIYPNRTLEAKVVEDSDMAGPLVFCLILGSLMMLQGKVNFGYIYGFSIFSCLGVYAITNLMCSTSEIDVWFVCSVLGYGLVPVIVLSGATLGINATSIVTGIHMKGTFGFILSAAAIAWATFSATRLFDAKMRLNENMQFWLVAYPVALVYWCFSLITVL